MATITAAVEANPPGEVLEFRRQRGLWSDAWRRLIRNRLAVVGLVVLALVALIAVLGSDVWITGRYEATEIDRTTRQAGPSWDHWFGTDQLGRDLWARVLEGVRVSLQIGLGTQILVLITGVLVGAGAILGGKLADNLLMRLTDITFAFPDLLFIILIREILLRRDLPIVSSPKLLIIVAIAMVNWTIIARLVRGQMLSLTERDFVIAARALGATRTRVVFQHMLPNTLGPVIVAITFGIPHAIFAEAALGFVGFGVPPPDVSLGTLVASGYAFVNRNAWNVVFPAAAVAVLMLSFTFVGDGLRDALDPRTRGSKT
ncbi:MAG: ABC transporter permease [Dehalococcoidia bacterium]